MKRLIFILLVIMMVVLTACKSKTDTENLEGTTAEIIDKIYEVKDSGLDVVTVDVDLSDEYAVKAYTGLDNADNISEASASESMIGAQAYSLVVVRLNDAQDAKDVAEAMKSGIDQRKWVCVEADDLSVAAYGDVVVLAMVTSELSDLVTSEELIDAFKSVCGGTLSVQL